MSGDAIDPVAQAREIDRVLRAAWDATMRRFGPADGVDGLHTTGRAIARRFRFEHSAHVHAAVRRRGAGLALDLAALGAELASIGCCADIMLGQSVVGRRASALIDAAPSTGVAAHIRRQRERLVGGVQRYRAAVRDAWSARLRAYFASEEADALWRDCAARWGQGPGYLRDVGRRFEDEAPRAGLKIDAAALPEPPGVGWITPA